MKITALLSPDAPVSTPSGSSAAPSGNAGGNASGAGTPPAGGGQTQAPSGARSIPNTPAPSGTPTGDQTQHNTRQREETGDRLDPKRISDEVYEQVETRIRQREERYEAERSHKTQAEAFDKAKSDLVTELLGDDKDDAFLTKAVRSLVAEMMESKREAYPDNHPLAGAFKPMSAAEIKKAAEELKLSDEIAAWRGSRLARIGRATKTVGPAVGGANTGQGKGKDATPEERAESEDRERRDKVRSRFAAAGFAE